MSRVARSIALTLVVLVHCPDSAFPQTPSLIFTFGVPERAASAAIPRVTSHIEERALALWGGTATDFGTGVSLRGARWTVRSMTSLTTLPIDHHDRPAFQQVDVVRPILAVGPVSIAGGGGVRQTWDGTHVFLARMLGTSPLGAGMLQGSVVIERATSSPSKRDAADVVTSVGWARPVGRRVSVGVEGIGQDLEGLWDAEELDGGAKLLVGPSLHVRSTSGEWSAGVAAGPVYTSQSPVTAGDAHAASSGRHFGVFASASWVPRHR